MDTSLELAQLRQDLLLLEHVLQLEKERRIQAERQAEAEKQVCLQLQLLLTREKKLRKAAGMSAPSPRARHGTAAGCSSVAHGVPANSSPPRQNTSESEGNSSALSQLDELMSSIFSDLPEDLQEMLGVWAPVATEPVGSRAEEAVKADDAKGLQTCLLSEGGKAGLSDLEKQKLLDVASENGYTGCVEVLLAAGCHPEVCIREDGWGPLHLAAFHGHTECAKVLLTAAGPGAIATSDKEGRTPIFLSLQQGHYKCASLLLWEAGGVVYSSVTKSGQTCLHAAILGHLPHLLRSLLVHIVTTFEPSIAMEIINHPDVDGTTVVHLAAANGYRDCLQVLFGCGGVVSNHRDRWNRTPLDVCAQNCVDLLMNRDSREVTVLVDLEDGLVEPDPTSIGKLHLMAHHTWTDVEVMVQNCLLDYCQHLRGTLPSTPSPHHHHTSMEVTHPCDLWTSSFAPHLKRVLGGGGGSGHVHHLLAALHAMQSSTCVMDWNGDSISGYRIGDVHWKPGEMTHAMSAKCPHALLAGLNSMSDHPHKSEILFTFKGPSQGCLDHLGWDLMIPISTLRQYIKLVESEKAVIIQGPRGSGKTSIVKGIAEYFKTTKQASVVTFSCHASIKRDDLLRLFHLNGLLVEGSRSTDDGSSISSIGSSHHRPQILILDDLDRLGDTFADLLSLLDYRGPDHSQWMDVVCDRDGSVAFSSGQYHLSENCYVMATRIIAREEYFVPIAEQFAYILLHPSSEPSLGMLQRHLRRKLIHCCHGKVPHRSDLLYRCVQWVWEVWHLYNYLIGQLELTDLVTGPKLFFSCPVEASDPENVCSWLSKLWNHRMVPFIEGQLQSKLGTRAISELFHALIQHVLKPFCPIGQQATNTLFQNFILGSVAIDQVKSSGVEENSTTTSLRKDIGEATLPFPNNVGAVTTPPLPRDVGVTGNSPSAATRNSSHATIVSYKDMIKNSPQFKGKNAKSPKTKSKKADDNNSDTASMASETGSLSGGPPRSRAKTFGLFGKESSFKIQKLFRKSSFKAPNPTKDAKKGDGGRAQSHASSDLHNLFDMFSQFGERRLNEQRSPAPSNILVSPLPPQPSPAPSHGSGCVVPKYILATSTPQEGGFHGDDDLSSPSLSHQTQLDQSCGVEGGQWEVGSLLEGMEKREEGDTRETTSPARHEDSLELDLSVSSDNESQSCLNSWAEVREGVGQSHPSPHPPEDRHLHPSSTSSSSHRHHPGDPAGDNSSLALRPHPLEVRQRRQSKRESWCSDMWDDPLGSNARSFSASLGFEPSSFGKEHRRFSSALVGQEEDEVGAEL